MSLNNRIIRSSSPQVASSSSAFADLQPSPLIQFNIDLANIDRADRQVRNLLRGLTPLQVANAHTGQPSTSRLGMPSCTPATLQPTAPPSGSIVNSSAASPTSVVPAAGSTSHTAAASPEPHHSVMPLTSGGPSLAGPSPQMPNEPLTQPEKDSLLAAWDRFSKPIKALHAAMRTPLRVLSDGFAETAANAPLPASRKAELLSDLAAAAEKIAFCPSVSLQLGASPQASRAQSTSTISVATATAASPVASTLTIHVPFPATVRDIDSAVTVILDSLDSPSLVIRLLGLHCAKFLCYDPAFFNKFSKHRGFYLVASAIDGEHPQESDYALTLVHSITRLKVKGTLTENLPFYIVSRVVSCLDPLEQRGAAPSGSSGVPSSPQQAGSNVTFAMRSRSLDILQLMLVAYPVEMSEADAIRPMLMACLSPSTPKEEMERIVVALLEAYDDPKRRSCIRDSDIGIIFSPFTDHSFREATMMGPALTNQQSSINAALGLASSPSAGTVTGRAREVICKFLSSWSGLLWLSTETAGIVSLIEALHLPGRAELKLSLISLFNQSLRRMAPHRGIPAQGPWEGTHARLRKGTIMGAGVSDDYDLIDIEDGSGISASNYQAYLVGLDEMGVGGIFTGEGGGGDDCAPITSAVGYHACDVFLGCLLLVLNHHGLPDALITVMRSVALREDNGSGSGSGDNENGGREQQVASNSTNPMDIDSTHQPVSLLREASLLLQHIIVLMDTLLPRATASRLHASLNEAISAMAADGKSFAGGLTNTLFHNLSYSSAGTSIYSSSMMGGGVVGGGSAGSYLGAGYGVASADAELSEAAFQALLKDSMVVESSNGATVGEASRLWSPEIILQLIEGPLRNPQRLRYARDKTPFLQRLLLFYKLNSSTITPPVTSASGNGQAGNAPTSPQLNGVTQNHLNPNGVTAAHFSVATARHHSTLSSITDARFKWTAIGVALMDLLLGSREGVEALAKVEYATGYKSLFDEILLYYQRQLKVSSQPLTNNSITAGAHHTRLSGLLSRDSLQEGIGKDILKIFVRFTLSANGLDMLKRNGILDCLKSLVTLVAATGGSATSAAPTQNGTTARGPSGLPVLNLAGGQLSATSSLPPFQQQQLADLSALCCRLLQYSYVGSVPNFGVCEELRHMMQSALGPTVEDVGLKNAAIDQLAKVIWRDLGGSLTWGIERLLALLDDSSRPIVTRAYKLLSNICFSSAQALDTLIAKKPKALLENKQLVDQRRMLNISSLLFRMAGHPKGFMFLQQLGWVAKELEQWEAHGAMHFVDDLQQVIGRAGSDSNQNTQNDGGHSPRAGAYVRHYRTGSVGSSGAAPNYRQAVTTVTTSMQTAHSVYPDHFVKDLCLHAEGCSAFGKSTLWSKSVATIMGGVANKTTLPGCNGRRRRGVSSDDHDAPSSSTDTDTEEEGAIRTAAALAVSARRRKSIADGAVAAITSNQHRPNSGTAPVTNKGFKGGSLIQMLRKDQAIAEDIDELFEYEGGAAEIQIQVPKRQQRGAHGHRSGNYYHAGTAGMNTVSAFQSGKRKTRRSNSAHNHFSSSSDEDDTDFALSKGYASKHATQMVECTVDPKAVVAALYVVAFAGSSDHGFELLIRADGKYPPYALVHKFIEITRYAVNPHVRGAALTCLSIISRSQLASSYLTSAYSCSVLNEASAYVTPNGVPYSVSFLQPNRALWMLVGRPNNHKGLSSRYSQKAPPSTKHVPKDIQELTMQLLSPVNREKAKAPLAALMKERPSLVVSNASVKYMRECSCVYRMRHAERKFLSDFFAKIRVVRYTHKKEKQLQKEQAALLALQQPQSQSMNTFGALVANNNNAIYASMVSATKEKPATPMTASTNPEGSTTITNGSILGTSNGHRQLSTTVVGGGADNDISVIKAPPPKRDIIIGDEI